LSLWDLRGSKLGVHPAILTYVSLPRMESLSLNNEKSYLGTELPDWLIAESLQIGLICGILLHSETVHTTNLQNFSWRREDHESSASFIIN